MTKHMLVVDSAAPVFLAYRQQFERQGVMIDACVTYEAAIALMNKRSYDVALVDVWQAGIWQKNGLDLLCLLRERKPDVKIILMTAIESDDAQKRGQDLGAAFFFEKPVFTSTIFEALKELGITK